MSAEGIHALLDRVLRRLQPPAPEPLPIVAELPQLDAAQLAVFTELLDAPTRIYRPPLALQWVCPDQLAERMAARPAVAFDELLRDPTPATRPAGKLGPVSAGRHVANRGRHRL